MAAADGDQLVAVSRSRSAGRLVDRPTSSSSRLATGDDELQAIDHGPALLGSLQAIRKSPTKGTVHVQLPMIARNFMHTKLAAELPYLLLNFMLVVNDQPHALDSLMNNLLLAREPEGISPAAQGQIMALIRDVVASHHAARERGNAPVSKAQAISMMDKAVSDRASEAEIQEALDALRAARFTTAAVNIARELVTSYRQLTWSPGGAGSLQPLQDAADRFEHQVHAAALVGCISAKRVRELNALITEIRTRFPVSSPVRIAEASAARRQHAEPIIAKAKHLLHELYVLKASLDARRGFTFNGMLALYANRADTLVEHRLPELERAIQHAKRTQDTSQIEAVFVADEVPWVMSHGGPVWLADRLRETHKAAVAEGDFILDIAGVFMPPALRLGFTACWESLKVAANDETVGEALVNIAIKAAGPSLDKLTGGPAVRNVFYSAIRGAGQTIARDGTKILLAPDKTTAEKVQALVPLLEKAILDGFVFAIAGRLKPLAANMDEGTRKQIYDKLLEAAGKLGIEHPLKPELDRFLESFDRK